MAKKKETTDQGAAAQTPKKSAKAGNGMTVAEMKQAMKAGGQKGAEAKSIYVQAVIHELEELVADFNETMGIESNLTGLDRKRLTSARVRNNGFIDKAFDVARDNPEFLPPHFYTGNLSWMMREMEDLRQLQAVADQMQRSVTDSFILQADQNFQAALRVYRSLQEQSTSKVPGAASLLDLLSIYFKPRRRATTAEPTAKELERDVKRLIHGKADGEIVIKNETPKTSGGIHEVVDNVRTGRSAVKETLEESEDEGTTTRRK